MEKKQALEGQSVRSLRLSRGMSQKAFSEQVLGDQTDHGFKSLSKIEKGSQALSLSQRKKIEAYFSTSIEDLVSKSQQEKPRTPSLILLSNEDYFTFHAEFIDEACGAFSETGGGKEAASTVPAEVWFFHPDKDLPVFTSKEVRDRWINNLRQGVNHHLVFPLPVTSADDLKVFFSLATELTYVIQKSEEQRLQTRQGEICFWAINPGMATENPAASRYRDYVQDYRRRKLAGLSVRPAIEAASNPSLEAILRLRRVVLGTAPNSPIPPYAATFLHDVDSDRLGNGVSGWLFYGSHTRAWISELPNDLRKAQTIDRNGELK